MSLSRKLLFHDRAFWRKVVDIGLPVSLSSMAFSLLGVVDVAMVTELGQDAIAAVSYGSRIMFFSYFFAMGWCGALTILAPQLVGAASTRRLQQTTLLAFYILLSMVSGLVLFYLHFTASIIELANSDPAFVAHASSYLQISVFSLLFSAIVFPIEINLRAYGKTRAISILAVGAIFLNMALNYIFLNGLLGLPQMGVAGVALGTVIARGVQATMLLVLVRKSHYRLLPPLNQILSFEPLKGLKQYLTLTLPVLAQSLAWSTGLVMFTILLGQMGVEEIALFGLIHPAESILVGFFFGFSMAASTLLGQSLGADQIAQARARALPLLVIPVALAITASVLVWLASPLIENVYRYSEFKRIDHAMTATYFVAFCLSVKVFNMIAIGGVLNSGGDVKFSMMVNVLCLWGISLPLTYYCIVVLQLDIRFVVLAMLSEDSLKSLFVLWRVRSGKWLNNLTKQDSNGETANATR
uniref:MATE family efflux transporter n=1 Tax=Thaumasiovibrio occultus TaxID=1891184 RepID=UPI00131C8CFE|nr:MATE family efflux transporter [Thaumasiovibrio occultus]